MDLGALNLPNLNLPVLVFVVCWIMGLAGTFIPVVPATLIIFVGTLAATLLDGLQPGDVPWLLGVGLITVAVSQVDNLTSAMGVRRWGGSRHGAWGAAIGGLVGLFLPLGLLIGPFGGAMVAEVAVAKRPAPLAARAAVGAVIGLLAGIAAKFVLHVLIGLGELARLL